MDRLPTWLRVTLCVVGFPFIQIWLGLRYGFFWARRTLCRLAGCLVSIPLVSAIFFALLAALSYWGIARDYHGVATSVASKLSFPQKLDAKTSHLVNLFGFAGIVASFVGVIYAWKQVRLSDDRINGYASFYRAAARLLLEIRQGSADEFLFWGSTILPGNIAYDDQSPIRQYQGELTKMFMADKDYDRLRRARVVVPYWGLYEYIYSWFYTNRIASRQEKQDAAWFKEVDKRRDDARDLQIRLLNPLPGHDRKVLELPNVQFERVDDSYFLCNGYRVIFAVPLHFGAGDDQERTRIIHPELIGFTTTDASIVRAFKATYQMRFPDNANRGLLLDRMYTRHLISGDYIEICLRDKGLTLQTVQQLTVDQLKDYDHDHFGGAQATERCINECLIDDRSRVLDIGSGFGGPARYMAEKTKCTVDGYEVQQDRWSICQRLTTLTGLKDKVNVVNADIQAARLRDSDYTHVVAFLSMLHIRDKRGVIRSIAQSLKPGGQFYIEDFHFRPNPNSKDREEVGKIGSPGLLTLDEYVWCLEQAGLTVSLMQDMTATWSQMARQRAQDYRDPNMASKYSDKKMRGARAFADDVAGLFERGVIHGVRLVCTKKVTP